MKKRYRQTTETWTEPILGRHRKMLKKRVRTSTGFIWLRIVIIRGLLRT